MTTKGRKLFNSLFALVLAFSLLMSSTGTAFAKKKDRTPKIDPDFLALVQQYPKEKFKVIIQRDIKKKDLKKEKWRGSIDREALKDGGRIRKQLDLVVSFSAELKGRRIAKLATHPKVRWISPDAPVVSTGVKPGTYTYRDEFNEVAFNNSDGTKDWSDNPWIEIGESNGPDSGDVEVDDERCVDGYCLELEGEFDTEWGAYRQVDIANASSAWLSFEYKRIVEDSTGNIQLEVSPDGGRSWETLDTFEITETDSEHQYAQYDLAPYASKNTQIRFIGYEYVNSEIHIDNFEISVQPPSPYREIVRADDLKKIDGQGVTVAVIDSGITDHLDLRESGQNVNKAKRSSSRIISNVVFGDYDSPHDEYAHGTHVAGIIAGNGVSSGGDYVGIAPGVNLVNVRVSNEEGLTYTSDVVDGLQWVYDNKDTYNIRVVNISINSTAPESYHTSPLAAAVEILWFNGITVVVASGNNGTPEGPSPVYPPANDPFVITVGSVEDIGTVPTDDDFVSAFSAYSTTDDGFSKPDLVAPGRNIVSLLAGSDVTAYNGHPKHHVDEYYFRMTGTSMAAPVVSGAIALLLQDEPKLTPDQVKYRLMNTANQDWPNYDAAKAGAGVVDAYAAVYGSSTESANQGITPSQMLATGEDAIAFDSVGWNTVGWNTVGWNTVGWNTVGWNTVGWNTVGWNTVGWNTVGWNTSTWDD